MQFFFHFSSIASGAQSSKTAHFTAFSPQILHLTADSREKKKDVHHARPSYCRNHLSPLGKYLFTNDYLLVCEACVTKNEIINSATHPTFYWILVTPCSFVIELNILSKFWISIIHRHTFSRPQPTFW